MSLLNTNFFFDPCFEIIDNPAAQNSAKSPFFLQSAYLHSDKVTPGSLFIALAGNTYHGSHFIPQVINKKVKAIMSDHSLADMQRLAQQHSEILWIYCSDSAKGMYVLAKHIRNQLACPIFVVAGSVGKTTTKTFLVSFLQQKYAKVASTQGNYNGILGIPLTFLQISSLPDALVLEVGIDTTGVMEHHLALIKPTAGCVTKIAEEHLTNMKDLATIAKEECKVLDWLIKNNGIFVISTEDPYLKPYLQTPDQGYELISSHHDRMPLTTQGLYDPQKRTLDITFFDNVTIELPMPLWGKNNALNALAAATLAYRCNTTLAQLHEGIKTFQQPYARSEIKKITLPSYTIHILYDVYNAQPASMISAFETLQEVVLHSSQKNPKVFIALGNMLDLGEESEKLHQSLAPYLIELQKHIKVDGIFFTGLFMQSLHKALEHNTSCTHLWFSSQESLAAHLKEHLTENSFLLLKGSRGSAMEKVLQHLEQA